MVVPDPHDAKNVYAPATFGLLVSRDAGESWRWLCNRAIGVTDGDEPSWTVTPKGTLVGATSKTIVASRDGCTFAQAGSGASAIAVRPSGEIVAVGPDNHLLLSTNDAQSFAASGSPIDPAFGVDSLAIAPSDPGRIYLAGRRGEGDARTGGLLVSYDGGMSWAARKLELAPGETPTLAGVDPAGADRVYLRTTGADAHARLLVSDDAGKTWKKVFESTTDALGFALSSDGKRVFVGTRDGVSSSASDAFAFTKGSSIAAHCLASAGSTLWACSSDRGGGFVVGTSRTGGRSFEAKLHLDEIKGPLECPADSPVAKACAEEWQKQRTALGIADVGEPRRSEPAGGPSLRGRQQRTGRAVNTRAAVFGIAAFGFAAYTILKRLRRRH